jgi:hypothetical protein
MILIPVLVCGDHWLNRLEVEQTLITSNCDDQVVLDLRAEGASLYALGIVQLVQQCLLAAALPNRTVSVDNWPNSVEQIPFVRQKQHLVSHFFWLSRAYQHAVPDYRTAEFCLGYFVGRKTVPRMSMLKDIQHHYRDKFLLSLMDTVAHFEIGGLDVLEQWHDADEFHQWYNQLQLPSLDGHKVIDQYRGNHNTNASLLRWYGQFDIELVSETYCHGDTFFVTEKTVRPLLAGKSMLVYGPKNYLARLRDLGFETWGNIWNEDYDQLVGPARWQAMQRTIDDLTTQDQSQLYQKCLPIVQHNQAHLNLLIEKYAPE